MFTIVVNEELFLKKYRLKLYIRKNIYWKSEYFYLQSQIIHVRCNTTIGFQKTVQNLSLFQIEKYLEF